MKKLLATLMILTMLIAPAHAAEKKLSIVCTTFPSYDWMREILGERVKDVDLSLLQDNGVDLHNFQPTAEHFIRVSSADMLVYVGGPSDGWVDDAVKEAKNKALLAVNLMDAMGDLVKEEADLEGMQETEHAHHHDHDDHDDDHDDHDDHDEHDEHDDHDDHDDDHDHDHEHHHHEHESDEHIWLSLRNARHLVKVLCEKLSAIDKEHADLYAANTAAYIQKLDALDKQYQEVVSSAKDKTVLFADRFPFLYLTEDYGLTPFAAFSGCSAETEASFETVAFLAGKMDELKLPAVLTIEGSDQRIAKAVLGASKDANRPILTLHSIQSINRDDVQNKTYLGIMQENLETLKKALQ